MIAINVHDPSQDLFEGKSMLARELYGLLIRKLDQIGPVRKTIKALSVSLENRKLFASVIIRNRSIKLILKADHRITSPRILSIARMADKDYEHTIVIESKGEIDEELMQWLEQAYLLSS